MGPSSFLVLRENLVMHQRLFAFVLIAVAANFQSVAVRAQTAAPAESRTKKVLLIGMDGTRFDALRAAKAPNLDRLIKHGALAQPIRIFPDRYREADTVSGPGWSSILTGVWADKHGVLDNDFKTPHYDKFPHFFALLKQVQPDAYTGSLADWEPIYKLITSAADMNTPFPIDDKLKAPAGYVTADAEIAKAAVKLLANDKLTAAFVYFGQIDETGHVDGFHPSVPTYIAAIERVDAYIGELLAALESRPNYADEDWLVLVTADHGGQGTGHGGGHNDPDVACSFLIVSGPAAQPGNIAEPCGLVDVVPTALAHLGVPIDPKWQLDGRAVGLRSTAGKATSPQ